ncbi:hypothetical protein ACPXCG_21745 [Gordonia sp. DT218]|uniref:hypothetical protein n=1 Tax=Gordonia sp. DT218 TaxID=3416659 RepID=UPI003CEF456E
MTDRDGGTAGGNVIEKLPNDPIPRRKCNSDRFRPNDLIRMRTQPTAGVGGGTERMVRDSGGPGASSKTARIMIRAYAGGMDCRRSTMVHIVNHSLGCKA